MTSNFSSFLIGISILSSAILHGQSFQDGRILFLLRQGNYSLALDTYQELFHEKGQHDFELLHLLGIHLLQEGIGKRDPEIQLLTLFGASIALHEEAIDILEAGLLSPFPEIQLIALQGLSQLQQDTADMALLRALGSNFLEVRLQAIHQLSLKRDPQALSQAESLLHKTPQEFRYFYPSIFGCIGNPASIRILRRLLHDPSEKVRLASIISIGKNGRDDLLPQIRQQAASPQYKEQEAAASVLAILGDGDAAPLLQKLTKSPSPTVAIAASQALFHLGYEEEIENIECYAKKGNLFAIQALGGMVDHADTLIELLQQPNGGSLDIHFNALLALHQQRHPIARKYLSEVLIKDKRDLAFTSLTSPGTTLRAWKVIPSASQILKDKFTLYQEHLNLKLTLLEDLWESSSDDFFNLADQIIKSHQDELIPLTIQLMQEMETPRALDWLKDKHQLLGSPLTRTYCNLALYQLKEEGSYGEQLRAWVRKTSLHEFIRFQPFNPWEPGKKNGGLTPEQKSQLLIKSFEAFAIQKDALGILELVLAIKSGHVKNRYALSGLLLRATQ